MGGYNRESRLFFLVAVFTDWYYAALFQASWEYSKKLETGVFKRVLLF